MVSSARRSSPQGSGLDVFQPQVIFLATGARDVSRFPTLDMGEDVVAQLAAQELDDWSQLWERANQKWNATLIQNNFEIGPGSVMGHYSRRYPAAREHYLERLNRMMADHAPAYVILHDLQGIAAEAGARSWFDPRFYLEFKMPCGPDCLVSYAHSVFSLLRAVLGRSKKVARARSGQYPLGRCGGRPWCRRHPAWARLGRR